MVEKAKEALKKENAEKLAEKIAAAEKQNVGKVVG